MITEEALHELSTRSENLNALLKQFSAPLSTIICGILPIPGILFSPDEVYTYVLRNNPALVAKNKNLPEILLNLLGDFHNSLPLTKKLKKAPKAWLNIFEIAKNKCLSAIIDLRKDHYSDMVEWGKAAGIPINTELIPVHEAIALSLLVQRERLNSANDKTKLAEFSNLALERVRVEYPSAYACYVIMAEKRAEHLLKPPSKTDIPIRRIKNLFYVLAIRFHQHRVKSGKRNEDGPKITLSLSPLREMIEAFNTRYPESEVIDTSLIGYFRDQKSKSWLRNVKLISCNFDNPSEAINTFIELLKRSGEPIREIDIEPFFNSKSKK